MSQLAAATALATLQANVSRTLTPGRGPGVNRVSGDERITLKERLRIDEERRRILRLLPVIVPEYLGLGIVSRKELLGQSLAACEITRETLPKPTDVQDVYGTLLDPMMGSNERNVSCAQCHAVGDSCKGHYGKIVFKRRVCNQEVPNPCFHPSFVKRIILLLQCVCAQCGSLILRDVVRVTRLLKSDYDTRLKIIAKESLGQECECGGGINPIYKQWNKTDPNVIMKRFGKDGAEYPVYPMEAYKILASITDADAKILGFGATGGWANRPADLILFGILVIPPRFRPLTYRNGASEEDDFTKHYINILKHSKALRNYTPPDHYTAQQVEEAYFNLTRNLMSALRDMIESPGGSLNSNETLLSFKDVMNGKTGFFRGMLNGKPTDFCARSVAGPGPDLDVNEVGVPMSFQSELTFPVRIFRTRDIKGKIVSNLDEMTTELRAGRVKWIERQGRRIRIDGANKDHEELRIGDVVARFMRDGDKIFVNRNPSLHGPSFQALYVRLMPVDTITINMALTKGFNADFDGDELNLHFPQTLEALAEMTELSDPKYCLLSEAKGGALVAAVIDGLTGGYYLTRPSVVFDRASWLDGFMALRSAHYDIAEFFARCKKYNRNPYLGRSLFSVLLPAGLKFKAPLKDKQVWSFHAKVDADGNSLAVPDLVETELVIEHGLLLSGAISDKHVGEGGTLANYLIKQYGGPWYTAFLSDYQRLCNWYLMQEGFTVNNDDCVNLEDVPAERQILAELTTKATQKALSYGPPKANKAEENRRQANYMLAMNSVREGAIVAFADKYRRSNLRELSDSGAKGGPANYFMMRGSIGLQTSQGGMLPKGLGEGVKARLTPFFPVGSEDPRAHGFCETNFGSGLSPADFIHHEMETRVSVAQGKTDTGPSGYAERRLMKLLEDLVVAFDGTTRNGLDAGLIQFVANVVGLRPAEVLQFRDDQGKYYAYIDMANVVGELNSALETASAVSNANLSPTSPSQPQVLTYDYITEIIDVFGDSELGPALKLSNFKAANEAAIAAHRALLRRQLQPLSLLDSPEARRRLRALIRKGLLSSMIPAGTAIGAITATSVGQIVTQLNLKQKGLVGTGSARVVKDQMTQMNTLLNAPEDPKDRTCYIYFKPRITYRQVKQRIKQFEYILVGKLLADADPVVAALLDRSWHGEYARIFNKNLPTETTNILRLTLNRQALFDYNISVAEVAAKISSEISHTATLLHSPNYLGLIDIFINDDASGRTQTSSDRYYYFLRNVILPKILTIHLTGIPGIVGSFPSYIPLISLIENERRQPASLYPRPTWRLYRNAQVERRQPLKLEQLVPLLVETGFGLVTDGNGGGLAGLANANPSFITIEALVDNQYTAMGPRQALQKLAEVPENFETYNLAYLETDGTNLARVMLLPGVDQKYTYSNHSKEMDQVLGVEAAEDMFLLKFNENLGSVIPTHSVLLADFMHHPGRPTAINRNGAAQQSKGAMSLASFEQAQQHILARAPFNPIEKMDVNPSAILGSLMRIGTGYSDILATTDLAEKLEELQLMTERGEVPYPEAVVNTEEDELAGLRIFTAKANASYAATPLVLPKLPANVATSPFATYLAGLGGPGATQPRAPATSLAGVSAAAATVTNLLNRTGATTITTKPLPGLPTLPITTPNIIPTNLPKALTVSAAGQLRPLPVATQTTDGTRPNPPRVSLLPSSFGASNTGLLPANSGRDTATNLVAPPVIAPSTTRPLGLVANPTRPPARSLGLQGRKTVK